MDALRRWLWWLTCLLSMITADDDLFYLKKIGLHTKLLMQWYFPNCKLHLLYFHGTYSNALVLLAPQRERESATFLSIHSSSLSYTMNMKSLSSPQHQLLQSPTFSYQWCSTLAWISIYFINFIVVFSVGLLASHLSFLKLHSYQHLIVGCTKS